MNPTSIGLQRPLMLLLVVLALLVTAACGGNRETALVKSDKELLTATSQGDFEKLLGEGDALWVQRGDRAKLEAAIVKWNEATKAATPNLSEEERRLALADLWSQIARGHYFLSDSHLRFSGGDDEAREEMMKKTYNLGVTSAEKALALYAPKFAEAIRANKDVEEAIPLLDKRAVPAMYWYASSIGKWASLEGFSEILSRKDAIKMMMDRLIKLDPNFFYGGPPRYLGAYFSRLPGFAGRDLDKSRKYFATSIEKAPQYLGTRVLMAQDLAVQLGDRELYQQLLEHVVGFDLNEAPDIKVENSFEQRKAKILLEEIDDKF